MDEQTRQNFEKFLLTLPVSQRNRFYSIFIQIMEGLMDNVDELITALRGPRETVIANIQNVLSDLEFDISLPPPDLSSNSSLDGSCQDVSRDGKMPNADEQRAGPSTGIATWASYRPLATFSSSDDEGGPIVSAPRPPEQRSSSIVESGSLVGFGKKPSAENDGTIFYENYIKENDCSPDSVIEIKKKKHGRPKVYLGPKAMKENDCSPNSVIEIKKKKRGRPKVHLEPLRCHLCEKLCSRSDNLQRHIREKHCRQRRCFYPRPSSQHHFKKFGKKDGMQCQKTGTSPLYNDGYFCPKCGKKFESNIEVVFHLEKEKCGPN